MSGVGIEPDARFPGGAVSDARNGRQFRGDIEGLRAVAVLLVVAYHAAVPGFGGGFIGVDAFFVISGFLITGLIVDELRRTGRVSLRAFYARRARRLLPAAVLVILVTVLASAVLLPPLRLPDVTGDAAASALYAGNLRFAAQATDYLQTDLAPSPLLHYWSLGVEEQFYLAWPLLLLIAARFAGTGRALLAAVGVVGVASFILSLWLTGVNEPLAFYLLPTRAWELALGGAVALGTARLGSLTARSAAALATLGIASILVGALAIAPDTPFPGLAALIPTVGTALVIAAGIRGGSGVVSRLLTLPPVRWIGRISYSLYLWHWPVLVLPAAAIDAPLPGPVRLALVGLAVGLAALSERFVERPGRAGRLAGVGPMRTLGLAAATSALVVATSVGTGWVLGPSGAAAREPSADVNEPPLVLPSISVGNATPGTAPVPASPAPSALPSRGLTPHGPVPADLIPPLAKARADLPPIYSDGCHLAVPDLRSPTCAYGDTGSSVEVVLFGDSHAAQWFPTLERLATERGWRLIDLTKSACPAADITVWSANLRRPYTECDTWRNAAIARIAGEHPALVVISNTRLIDLAIGGAPVPALDREALWEAAVGRTLAALRASAGHVVLLGDTPNPDRDPPVCLSAHPRDAYACATPLDHALAPTRTEGERTVAAGAGVAFVDPSMWICPTEPCPAVIGRYLVYRDGGHITRAFARELAPYLGPVLLSVDGGAGILTRP